MGIYNAYTLAELRDYSLNLDSRRLVALPLHDDTSRHYIRAWEDAKHRRLLHLLNRELFDWLTEHIPELAALTVHFENPRHDDYQRSFMGYPVRHASVVLRATYGTRYRVRTLDNLYYHLHITSQLIYTQQQGVIRAVFPIGDTVYVLCLAHRHERCGQTLGMSSGLDEETLGERLARRRKLFYLTHD